MVNVAIAGGTGAVGRTLVEVLASQDKHHAIILTRKDSSKEENSLAPVFNVDHSDIGALKSFLEEHNVHAVISAFGIMATSLATSQLNLIKAAGASSFFCHPLSRRASRRTQLITVPPSWLTLRSGVAILPPLEHYFTSLKALEATSLEWAVVHNGTFLDYFAPPSLKTHHPYSVLVVDMEHNAAGIPGDGNEPVTLTYTFDVARFVVAALDLGAWPRELRVVGDELTFNELVAIAEEVKGVKFEVAYDGVEKLRESQITELAGHAASCDKFPRERLQWFLAIFELWMATGRGRVPREGTLNEMIPEIKPLTAREMVERYWATVKYDTVPFA